MKFSKIGKHTIRCVITEQEIMDLGYTIEEIMSNGERTQEFMNRIFDMAEQNFETKFELGIKTVRADFMSDHTLTLTFSEHPGSDEMLEHLKDIVNGIMNSIPQQKWNGGSGGNQNGKKEETRERPDMVRARITRAKVDISAPRVFSRVTVVRVETKAVPPLAMRMERGVAVDEILFCIPMFDLERDSPIREEA